MAELAPGGKKRDVPLNHKGDYMPQSQIDRLAGQTSVAPFTSPTSEMDSIFSQKSEKVQDPSLLDIPERAALSTGPYTQDGIYIIGAPKNSAFKFDETSPRVEGKLISRHGKLWIKDENGNLTEPPENLLMYGWITTRKTHRLLPKHFIGADSAKPLPNFEVETWVIE